MNKFLLAAIAALAALAAGPASAADISVPPYRPPPAPVSVPAPIHNWTGLYLGGAFGYGLWDADTSLLFPTGAFPPTSPLNSGGRGWAGQVLGGYDYQFAIMNFNLVAGVFGDYSFSNIKGNLDTGTVTAVAINPIGGSEKEKSYWDVGGRFGVLMTPQILTYWNAGYTGARFDGVNLINFGPAIPPGPMSIAAHNYHGWFTGGGVETQVTSIPGLFFNTEYRYASYSSATLPIANATANFGLPVSLKFEPHVQTVMSGVRYKFNWPQ